MAMVARERSALVSPLPQVVAVVHAAVPGLTAPRAVLDHAGAPFCTFYDVDAVKLFVIGDPAAAAAAGRGAHAAPPDGFSSVYPGDRDGACA